MSVNNQIIFPFSYIPGRIPAGLLAPGLAPGFSPALSLPSRYVLAPAPARWLRLPPACPPCPPRPAPCSGYQWHRGTGPPYAPGSASRLLPGLNNWDGIATGPPPCSCQYPPPAYTGTTGTDSLPRHKKRGHPVAGTRCPDARRPGSTLGYPASVRKQQKPPILKYGGPHYKTNKRTLYCLVLK